MQSRRPETLTTHLIRAGFADLTRSATLWQDPDLVAVLDRRDRTGAAPGGGPDRGAVALDPAGAALLRALAAAADPDLALLQLVRLAAAAPDRLRALLTAPDDRTEPRDPETGGGPDEPAGVGAPARPAARDRLVRVLGASSALGDELVRHPALLGVLADPAPGTGIPPRDVRAELLRAVDADPDSPAPVAGTHPGTHPVGAGEAAAADTSPSYTDRLRRAYRARLLRIAATDVTAPDPTAVLPAVAAALADLAAAALEGALAVARSEEEDHGAGVRLAVLGMGKTGGRELNYISDVDVIYVAEPATLPDGSAACEEDDALRVAARLAGRLAQVCSGASAEPALWQVDAALRPEGKQGPLVRTLASHLAYYERWAVTWEFQALLKARPVAGDLELGEAYCAAVGPLVWQAVERPNFVEDARAMRKRVEDNVPVAEADRQIKLGKGGLRDVEFTVQLLQLVHGRADEDIRSRTTLDALAALSRGGYVGREHARRMEECYRFLRALEHRIQLFRLRRTHLMPTAEADLRRLARGLGQGGADDLVKTWRTVRREVRDLHEAVYYRPLLPATALLSTGEASLAPRAAVARFAAIGYRDPEGAMRHVQALTDGVSRRAAIQRQLLPVLLGWFADGADPDEGLLAFRKLSDTLGSTHWYLRLLRDSAEAASRLAQVLSSSRYLADAIGRSPESVRWLAQTESLAPRGVRRLASEADALLGRAQEVEAATVALRALRRRELARTGVAELLGEVGPVEAAKAISDAADVVLAGGLRIAEHEARAARQIARGDEPARLLIVAMGRLGGQELGYGSDADVMFVYEAVDGAPDKEANDYALTVAKNLRRILSAVGPEPGLPVDADLRPEGRNGPLVRSFDSYVEYYGRWSSPWEAQALLRARALSGTLSVVAAGGPEEGAVAASLSDGGAPSGSPGLPDGAGELDLGPGAEGGRSLGARFTALIDPLRYPDGGPGDAVLREVRRIKARVESERLPRGADPARHLKLGRGGVSDVEWTVQLLQLQHAFEVPALRTTGTVAALEAARDADLLSADDAEVLLEAWRLASRLRSAIVLWSGRTTGAGVDMLPHDSHALTGIARLLGDVGTGPELEELYLRVARRARTVMERVFYGA
ncbi:bifunctional [glutamine synthetase] adenylyltransferase/[glutamine synthetase]-adenylyl-L-tyrosine phosphorylase [Promicromonospora thailandica]|uniref:Bifunctional glutamine synthetase adenylyltransferase/adenylyl-removing enzyme n=1 Tax=Promicromonospora thailandica TaxID=765201 RepID=A0A9X2G2N3_9MICO|nr:bifunctional [glutamine synthetase] adenylyltransferase/[glutamine synthetase]-adenylyl-L-tyrosine phosphorylase [Promicromonospora thailandica]MCP2265960.1 glutamate-ammonia-ligase adenylyltransferase [Promicromonospora thailandica]